MHHSQKRYKTLYFFAALIAAAISVLLIELGGIGDSDYYWHIVLGREICSTHTIPVADTFSWISQELSVRHHCHSAAILGRKTSEHRHDSLCGLFLSLERPIPEPGLETVLAIAGFEFPLGEPAWRVFAYSVRVHCSFHSDVLSARHQYLRSCQ